MAKQMSAKASIGVTCPSSYWVPVQINLNKINRTGQVVFYGYASLEAKRANASPIGQKVYEVSTSQYDQFFAPTALGPEGANPAKAAYLLADSVKEGLAPNLTPDTVTGVVPIDTRVGFFSGALDV